MCGPNKKNHEANKNLLSDVKIKRLSRLIKNKSRQPTFASDDKKKKKKKNNPCRYLTFDHKKPQRFHPCNQSKLSPSEALWCRLPSLGCLDKVTWPSNSSKETDLDAVQQKYRADHLQPELSQSLPN